MDCKSCGLEVRPYKQNEQVDPELCEFCFIADETDQDYTKEEYDGVVEYRPRY